MTSRGLYHRLQFCSRFELQHGRLGELDVAAEMMRVENGFDVLQASGDWTQPDQ